MTRRTVLIGNANRPRPATVDKDWWEKQIDQPTAAGWSVIGEWDTTPETPEASDDYFAARHNDNVISILAGRGPITCDDDEEGDEPA